MKKDGYCENTIGPIGRRLRNLAQNVNLGDPERVKEFIARAGWSNGYKDNITMRARKPELMQNIVNSWDAYKTEKTR